VALGIAYDEHSLTTAEIVRVLTALPCMLMMYKCLKYGTSPSDRKNAVEHDGRNDAWNDVGDGLIWLLIVVVLVLAAAALIKYLRS